MATKPILRTDRETRGTRGIVKPREFFTPEAPAPTKSGPKKKKAAGTPAVKKETGVKKETKAKATMAKKETKTKAKGALNKVKGAKVEKKSPTAKKPGPKKAAAPKANGAAKK